MTGCFKSYTAPTVALPAPTLVLSHDGSPDTSHKVDPAATVTLNGKKALLPDLKVGDEIDLSGDPATAIKATR